MSQLEQNPGIVMTPPLTEAQREIWYGAQMSDAVSCLLLALINSTAPNSSYGQFRWTLLSAFRFAKNIFLWGVYSFALHPQKLPRFVQWKARSLARRLRPRRRESRPASIIETFDPGDLIDLSEFPEEQRRVWQKHLRALIRYHPESYDGHLTLFRNPVHLVRCSFDSTYGWGGYAARWNYYYDHPRRPRNEHGGTGRASARGRVPEVPDAGDENIRLNRRL